MHLEPASAGRRCQIMPAHRRGHREHGRDEHERPRSASGGAAPARVATSGGRRAACRSRRWPAASAPSARRRGRGRRGRGAAPAGAWICSAVGTPCPQARAKSSALTMTAPDGQPMFVEIAATRTDRRPGDGNVTRSPMPPPDPVGDRTSTRTTQPPARTRARSPGRARPRGADFVGSARRRARRSVNPCAWSPKSRKLPR